MNNVSRLLTGTAVLGALMLGGAGIAHAGTTSSNFTAEMPHLQGDWNSAAQSKSTASSAGSVSISSVGASYGANARMCASNNHDNCGTELKALTGGKSGSLKNSFSKGSSVVLQLHETPWSIYAVTAKGSWKSN